MTAVGGPPPKTRPAPRYIRYLRMSREVVQPHVEAILDVWYGFTARVEHDQAWLDYQHEIGLRHHRAKKNQTDGAASTELVPFRNLFALVFLVTFTLRPFLAKNGDSSEDVEKMHAAWVKSCLLQDGDF